MSQFKQAFDQVEQANVDHPESVGFPYDINFPEINLRTVDFALKKWFEFDQPIFIKNHNKESKQVKVLYSTEQRWAAMQKHPDVRDKSGQLRLPLISVRRTNVDPMYERTVPADKDGTANIKLFVYEYTNPTNGRKEYTSSMMKDPNKPIIETLEILPPKFVRVTYNVIFWANFIQDMNPMIEHMILRFHNKHAIYVSHNIYFSAFLDSLSNDSNDAAIQQDEHIYKTNFTILVEAPLISKESLIRKRGFQTTKTKVKFHTLTDKEKELLENKKFEWYNPYSLNG